MFLNKLLNDVRNFVTVLNIHVSISTRINSYPPMDMSDPTRLFFRLEYVYVYVYVIVIVIHSMIYPLSSLSWTRAYLCKSPAAYTTPTHSSCMQDCGCGVGVGRWTASQQRRRNKIAASIHRRSTNARHWRVGVGSCVFECCGGMQRTDGPINVSDDGQQSQRVPRTNVQVCMHPYIKATKPMTPVKTVDHRTSSPTEHWSNSNKIIPACPYMPFRFSLSTVYRA